MSNFFSSDADMAYLVHTEELGHLFPASSGPSQPNIMYSPSPQDLPHRMGSSQPAQSLGYQQHNLPVANSPYAPYSYWSTRPSLISQTYTSYSNYPPLTEGLPSVSLSSETPLALQSLGGNRSSRSHSASSNTGLGVPAAMRIERSPPHITRSLSPSSPDLRAYGHPNKNGTWSCAYPGCTSRAVFTRGCDLRKHHKRHTKLFFCRHESCPQSAGGGFSSKKDLARHEAKHNPGVLCDWEGCDRVFSRVDNMRDHVKRIHLKASRPAPASRA
ncbi:hypothetical protein GQ43DRAFT_382261 [Delitschia confertaspora ATCC 74209]|uniref:C2H2-type domain-containing protein n=1 Tax=Delitschia confertaspora ATCC 74209 TaxID=1513339 RepID=A0A9P4JGP9_9PLEO|nr:hypothetical protein GQ43DRAFT_382261 [Delitschia confertaspora ATCC 74209]